MTLDSLTPVNASDEPLWPPIVRGTGVTASEKYLAKLADRSFLNLWSYPNTFIDKRTGGTGDGKELCDLLVVCGDHVLIFSDKTVAWPSGSDQQLAWKRWYRRAVQKSVDQIRGAERWITQFPERIFLDRQCSQRLPVRLPPAASRKVHRIAVALGASEACTRHFGEGSGSLLIMSSVTGEGHWNSASAAPFIIGDVEPIGGFVHVLDDVTLDIVMAELDTISDLTAYLAKKEQLMRSGSHIVAGGEEELVAHYVTHINSADEHDFVKPDGSSPQEYSQIIFDAGTYKSLLGQQQFVLKKSADEVSYFWDRLIETFTKHMIAGTSIVPDGQAFNLSDLEEGIRHMALVPRHVRRIFSEAILDPLRRSINHERFTRGMMPGPTEANRETGFFFMTLAVPSFRLDGGYEQYRNVRRRMLETYAFAFLQKYENLKQVVGITTESLQDAADAKRSEDIIIAERSEWSQDFVQLLEERKAHFGIVQQGNFHEYQVR